MRKNARTQEQDDTVRGRRTIRGLLLCGILSSVLYVVGDVLAARMWDGYSYANQAVSELAGLGAPTRPFMLGLFTVYNVLVVVFAAGVWRAAHRDRALRATAIAFVVYAVVGELTQLFSPMTGRGAQMAANDVGHIVLTAVEVLSIILFIALGSGAGGRGFRAYSVASILVIIAAGVLTGYVSTGMTADAASTPWAGLLERVNIYGTMLWIGVFAAVLRRAPDTAGGDAQVLTQGQPSKKVIALVGSGHKGGATYTAARTLLDYLEERGSVVGEVLTMSDYDIRTCRGCKVCFDQGEEHCPLRDDRDVLVRKMMEADGVVFASPNYSWQVSGLMKVFLDRIAFMFHRPRFHGKAATAIVVQGIAFGGRIRKYLEFVAGGLGFRVVKGSVIRTLEPMTQKALDQMDRSLSEQSRRFHRELFKPAYPVPSLLGLMMFRMSRTGIRLNAPRDKRDWAYYQETGWFESDFYYPVDIGPIRRAAGALFDWMGAHTSVFKTAQETLEADDSRSSRPAPQ